MSNVTQLFETAELAQASYANLFVGGTNLRVNADALQSPSGAGTSPTQLIDFAKRYPAILTQFNDEVANGGMGTGLSATVFRDAATPGNLTLAFRGTELVPNDLGTALNIWLSSAGYDQIVAMVNWWNRASALKDVEVAQFSLGWMATSDVPAGAVVLGIVGEESYVLAAADRKKATGELYDALQNDPDHKVEVTGHSLGGHLAMAFSTIFASSTAGATVFNAPGFIDNATNRAFFEKLGGSIPAVGAPNITNVIADGALIGEPPFKAIAALHSRPGQPIGIAIEDQFNSDELDPFGSLNHSMVTLADSLAVYRLLSDLYPNLTEEQYKSILNLAAQGASPSYERVLDALETLFAGDRKLLESGNGKREALYQAIYGLRSKSEYSSRLGQLQIPPMAEYATAILAQAQNTDATGLAHRYALAELNPFVVVDVNGTGLYAGVLEREYGDPNSGALDSYNAEANRAGLTQSYLADRADFLERKLFLTGFNLDDNYQDPLTHTDPSPGTRAYDYQMQARHYEDKGTGFVASTGVNLNSLQHFAFGTERPDLLVGGMLNAGDRLYGGAGNDWLVGRYGDDYLEGGTGKDVYEYNASSGILGSTNDGIDTILDADGKGVLRYTYTEGGVARTRIMRGPMLAAAGADDAALGGDLAYWTGKNGSLAGMSLAAAQAAIGAPGFGADAQTLHPFSGLQEGLVKLS